MIRVAQGDCVAVLNAREGARIVERHLKRKARWGGGNSLPLFGE